MSVWIGVTTGRVQVQVSENGRSRTVAVLNEGDFFGEMALVQEEGFRSAGAVSSGKSLLFELIRGDLDQWIRLNPQPAVKFFAELLNIQSERLRRTEVGKFGNEIRVP